MVIQSPQTALEMQFGMHRQRHRQRTACDDVAAMGAAKNIVVVLDPGHDDTHAGARRNGLEEEDLTLKIAQYCKAELSQYQWSNRIHDA